MDCTDIWSIHKPVSTVYYAIGAMKGERQNWARLWFTGSSKIITGCTHALTERNSGRKGMLSRSLILQWYKGCVPKNENIGRKANSPDSDFFKFMSVDFLIPVSSRELFSCATPIPYTSFQYQPNRGSSSYTL